MGCAGYLYQRHIQLSWKIRSMIGYINELEREVDLLQTQKQTYLLCAQVKAELSDIRVRLKRLMVRERANK